MWESYLLWQRIWTSSQRSKVFFSCAVTDWKKNIFLVYPPGLKFTIFLSSRITEHISTFQSPKYNMQGACHMNQEVIGSCMNLVYWVTCSSHESPVAQCWNIWIRDRKVTSSTPIKITRIFSSEPPVSLMRIIFLIHSIVFRHHTLIYSDEGQKGLANDMVPTSPFHPKLFCF